MKQEATKAIQIDKDTRGINFSLARTTDEKAHVIYEQVETKLKQYTELHPEELYTLTIEKSAYFLNYSDLKDNLIGLAASLTDTFREGTEQCQKI